MKKKHMNPLLVSVIITIIIFVVVTITMPIIGNLPEIYTDISIDILAMTNQNKSYEVNLFWFLIFISAILTVIIDLLYLKFSKSVDNSSGIVKNNTEILLLLIINFSWLIIKCSVNKAYLLLLVAYILFDLFVKENKSKMMYFAIIIYYMLLALNSLATYIFNFKVLTPNNLFWGTSIICFVTVYFIKNNRDDLLDKFINIFQVFIPLIFLPIINNKYMYNNEIIRVPMGIKYPLLVIGFILLLMIVAINNVKRNLKLQSTESDYIFITTIICIFAYHSFTIGANLIISTDLHHNPENFVLFQQWKNFGQIPYQDVIPASGLFPLLYGSINDFLFGGVYSTLPLVLQLMRLSFACLSIFLFSKIFDKRIAFVVALFFSLPFYNRIYFILPVLFILMLPQLIKNITYWLPTWVFICFLSGLYYPLYGVALVVGSLPFGIIQIYRYIKSKQLFKDFKNYKFYIVWIICLTPIVFNIKLLLNIVKHNLIMSKQSLLGEGISIFNCVVPNDFLSYINNDLFKRLLIYSLKFLLPISVVIFAIYYLFCLLYNNKQKNHIYDDKFNLYFLGLSSIIGVALVSFSFTIIREDSGVILSRSTYIVAILFIVLIGLIYKKYEYNNSVIITLITLNLLFFNNTSGFNTTVPQDFTVVPEGYVYNESLDREYVENIGNGFISCNVLDPASFIDENYESLEMDEPLLSTHLGQGMYLLNNIEMSATGTTIIAKDYYSQKYLIDMAKKSGEPFIINDFNSLINYYIYYHFLVEENYRLGANGFYMSPETLVKYFGEDYISPDIRRTRFYGNDVGNISASLGNSIKTLYPMFDINSDSDICVKNIDTNMLETDKNEFKVSNKDPLLIKYFDEPINGTDADFLYLDFSSSIDISNKRLSDYYVKNNKGEKYKVKVYWKSKGDTDFSDDKYIVANYCQGKLLIPLGMNPSWLFDEQIAIRIDFEGDFKIGDTIKLNEMQLLKLHQER